MKTMLDTKIYNDTWFYGLSTEAKLLFLFLVSNDSCNLIGCYELPASIISSYTGISLKSLPSVLKELEPKVMYLEGWVIIKNYGKYNPMRNPSIDAAKEKQLADLPSRVFDILTGCKQGVDTLVPGSKETESEQEEGKREESVREERKPIPEDVTPEMMEQISLDYAVPIAFVRSKHDDMVNWHRQDPKKNKKSDWVATLRNWVKKDAEKIVTAQRLPSKSVDAAAILAAQKESHHAKLPPS